MVFSLSMRFPATPPAQLPVPLWRLGPPRVSLSTVLGCTHRRTRIRTTFRAVEESKESAESEAETPGSSVPGEPAGPCRDLGGTELSELGAEIKRAMEQRKEKAETNLLSGVGEEVREIEWPAFGKVLGTTGVVLGVIAGSSVALLTVNAVLAELSDKVFAGKGIQDFFG
ncbi:LOW QUALITY PROTEIN: preprotein translocase subunit SECE1 [Punica granatum]|uniref:LOW QUALITY PROTEIN: preprotein translocase subunit SECE1 n=1 Tax=Punica granatum TaxID=22663 RepID=A0A6P8CG80_PUNGR|nr:LOW QUALITY PROTEIN: preprotein translocase subunit SECE1 [Punica granatum]